MLILACGFKRKGKTYSSSLLLKDYHPHEIEGINLFIASHENRRQGLAVGDYQSIY